MVRIDAKVEKNFDSLTKNQTLVLDCLKQAQQPLGAYTLLNNLQGKGVKAPLQVYRALTQLAEKGLVHKIESLNSWTLVVKQNMMLRLFSRFVRIVATSKNI